MLLDASSKIKVMEGAKHNLPDTDAQRSAESICQLACNLTEGDLLLVLISGTVLTCVPLKRDFIIFFICMLPFCIRYRHCGEFCVCLTHPFFYRWWLCFTPCSSSASDSTGKTGCDTPPSCCRGHHSGVKHSEASVVTGKRWRLGPFCKSRPGTTI